MADNFKALVLSQADDKIENQVTELSVDDLPEGDVLVRVEYSDVNYKDGMVVNGIGGLVRNYPHVPGIDFAGVVE
ncbi:MAG: oxidoreductase, partial [Pseudomonadota bacterium]|nr:oxidoreductase [Pseudomonadota bacterium]